MGLPCKRVPIPSYKVILLLFLIPIASIVVYYQVHFNNPKCTGGGIYPTLSSWSKHVNACIVAVPFHSGQLDFAPMYNVTFFQQANRDGEACDSTRYSVSGTVDGKEALVIENLDGCYPEAIAAQAAKLNFDVVVFESPFKVAGFSALSIWKKNGAPIPILEVNNVANASAIEIADISPSQNPFLAEQNQITMNVLSAGCGILGVVQVWVAVITLLEMGTPWKLNTKFGVAMLQVFSGLLRVIFASDLSGYHHTFSYPVYLYLVGVGSLFVFGTIFFVGAAFHFALLASNKAKANLKPIYALGIFVIALMIFNVAGYGYAATLVRGSSNFIVIASIVAAVFQVISGIYFFYSKVQVVKLLKQSASNRQTGRNKELNRMSVYMYLSIIPMLGFLGSMLLYLERYRQRGPQIISVAVAVQCLSLTELTLICSFPVKSRPQRESTATDLRMETKPTGSVPNLTARLSSDANAI